MSLDAGEDWCFFGISTYAISLIKVMRAFFGINS